MEISYFWILIIIFVIARALLENLFNSEESSPSPAPEENGGESAEQLNYSDEQTSRQGSLFAEEEPDDDLARELAEEEEFFQQSTGAESEKTGTESEDSSRQQKEDRGLKREIGSRKKKALTGIGDDEDQKQRVGVIADNEIKDIQQQGLKHSDLVRGIIMMEILDKPRAYRPHNPPHRQTKK